MGSIERQSTGKQTMAVADCPCCGGSVEVQDCGYTSFNPGVAKCAGRCKRQWSFSSVEDQWDCGVQWNKLAADICQKLRLFSMLCVRSKGMSISRDYHREELEDQAEKLLKSFEDSVIGADRT